MQSFQTVEEIIRNGRKYTTLYADPPWTYNNKGVNGSACKHYKTISFEELKQLPVSQIAADDSVLFLWVTYPMLPEGLELLRAWGFEYKTVAFTWVKRNRKSEGYFMGTGFWTRSNAETCMLGVRGKPKRQAGNVRQLIVSPLEGHSKKPDEARERIVQLMGDRPRIELFARQTYDGWDALGDELEEVTNAAGN